MTQVARIEGVQGTVAIGRFDDRALHLEPPALRPQPGDPVAPAFDQLRRALDLHLSLVETAERFERLRPGQAGAGVAGLLPAHPLQRAGRPFRLQQPEPATPLGVGLLRLGSERRLFEGNRRSPERRGRTRGEPGGAREDQDPGRQPPTPHAGDLPGARAQGGQQLGSVGRTIRRRRRPAAVEERAPGLGYRSRVRRRRQTAGEHLVHHAAEGVDVGGGRQGTSVDLLRGHVPRGAAAVARSPAAVEDPRQTEVGDHRAATVAVRHQQHVRALEIEVEHPGGVGCGEARGELSGDGARILLGQRTVVEALRQRLAGQELHRHDGDLHRRSVVLVGDGMGKEVEDAADVGMGDGAGGEELGTQPIEAGALGGPRADDLERDLLVEEQVVGSEHLPVAAASEQTADAKAPGDDLATDEDVGLGRRPASARARVRSSIGAVGKGGRGTRGNATRRHRERRKDRE